MRDKERIDRICELLKFYWHKVPDWRFMQLITNLLTFMGKRDGYYMEDEEFENCLKGFFKHVE